MRHSSEDRIPNLDPDKLIAQLMPARSRLYHLQPIGVGTPYVECLTGFAARLAHRHGITVSDMMTNVVRPFIGKPPVSNGVAAYSSAAKAVNGTGSTASELVSAIEELTQRKNLKFTTMLPWRDLLSWRLLIRPKRAWCPACYEERADAREKVYDQLIWAIESVTVCPKHRRRLESICPHCGRRQRHISLRSRPGHCHVCKQWLPGRGKREAEEVVKILPPSEKELWVATQVGELLATAPDRTSYANRASFARGLSRLIDKHAWGGTSPFALDLPVHEGTIGVWLRQAQAPKLGLLLEICFRLNESLSDLIYSEVGAEKAHQENTYNKDTFNIDENSSRNPVATDAHEGSVDWEVVENLLREAATKTPPPSLTTIAKRFRCDKQTLKHKFPELTASLIKRWLDCYPPLDHASAEQALIAACTENPPPTVSEIWRRLGRYGGPTRFIQKFPELCKKITKRYRAHRKREPRLREYRKTTPSDSRGNPPPSFLAVTKRLNISRGLLATKFKTLAAKISSRFITHRREMKEAKRASLTEEVTRICLELYAEELHPSRERVISRLRMRKRDQVVDEIRREVIKKLKSK